MVIDMATQTAGSLLNQKADWKAAFDVYKITNNLNDTTDDYAKFAIVILESPLALTQADATKLIALEKEISEKHPVTAGKIHKLCITKLLPAEDPEKLSLRDWTDWFSYIVAYLFSRYRPVEKSDFGLKTQRQALALQYYALLPKESQTLSMLKKCLNFANLGSLSAHQMVFSFHDKDINSPEMLFIIAKILEIYT